MSPKNLGFLYNFNIVKNRGFPPVYKIERVAKMSIKCAFFSVFQKIMVVCCAIFLGFANAFAANLPSGYTELEYVTFDGTNSTGAYVDTGLKYYTDIPNTKIRLVADAKVYNGSGWQLIAGNHGYYSAYIGLNSENKIAYSAGSGDNLTSTSNSTNRCVWDMDAVNKKVSVFDTVAGTNIVNLTNIPVTAQTYAIPVLIGGFTNNSSSLRAERTHMDLYSVKIYNNGTLVFDGVPAKYGNTVGIYDLVRGSFKSSASTALTAGPVVGIRIATTTYNNAQFNPVVTDLNSTIATIRSVVTNTINQTKAIADLQAKKQTRPDEQCPAGKKCLLVEDNDGVPHWYEIIENIYGLPTGYTPLEYIESTGTQYIDTGYAWTSLNRKVDMDVMVTTYVSNSHFFASTHERAYDLNPYFASASGSFSTYIGGRNYLSTTSNKNEKNNIVWNLKSNKNFNLQINNVNIGSVTVAEIPTSGVSVYLLHVHTSGNNSWTPLKARLYQTKMWDNDIMVRNFVPAKRNSDGVIGMYDLADTNPATAFHTNAGTGTFTAGPEI